MGIFAGHGRAAGGVGSARPCAHGRHGRCLLRLDDGRQTALGVALRQHLDGKVGAVALAEAAADAVLGLDDRVVRQLEGGLRADLDADIAALAPVVDPSNVDVIDDGWRPMGAAFGGVKVARGGLSRRGPGRARMGNRSIQFTEYRTEAQTRRNAPATIRRAADGRDGCGTVNV